MGQCQNQTAGRFAFPNKGATPVDDRQMTLTIPCHEEATQRSSMAGLGSGKNRRGATVQTFVLCDNHAEVFQQIDTELVQDGWSPTFQARPERIDSF